MKKIINYVYRFFKKKPFVPAELLQNAEHHAYTSDRKAFIAPRKTLVNISFDVTVN